MSGIGMRFLQPMVMAPMPLPRDYRWQLMFDNQMGTFVLVHNASRKGGSYTHGMVWISAGDIEREINRNKNMTHRTKCRLIRKARRIKARLVPA